MALLAAEAELLVLLLALVGAALAVAAVVGLRVVVEGNVEQVLLVGGGDVSALAFCIMVSTLVSPNGNKRATYSSSAR
jgi:hypothetical protein